MLTRYGRLGASSRLRSYQYIPYLAEHGVSVDISPLFDDDYVRELYVIRQQQLKQSRSGSPYLSQSDVPVSIKDKSKSTILVSYMHRLMQLIQRKKYDFLWIEKELFPWLPAFAETILCWARIPYVIDIDDAIFHKYDRHASAAVRYILGDKIKSIMHNASAVFAGNQYLAHYARESGAMRVEIIPTVVDLSKYPLDYENSSETAICKIGWIGSPSTVWYLEMIKDALKEICNHHPVELVIVGGGNIDLGDITVRTLDWSEESEVRHIKLIDIGIMPLPDSPYEQGKCGYKLIQYMACGLPVVASPVGVNKEIVEHGMNGYTAHTQDEWILALSRLVNDKKLRSQMGVAGRVKVNERYCLDVTAPNILQILNDLQFAKLPISSAI